MIAYSTQIRTVTSLALSFQKNEKINVSVSNTTLDRDKIFLKPTKYQQQIESNFKFISLWVIFKYNTSKIDTLKYLQDLTGNDIKDIMKEKQKLVLYQNTLDQDIIYSKSKILTSTTVFDMYKKNKVSFLFVFWYFKNTNSDKKKSLSRLQQRQLDRIRFLLSYFPPIEGYINSYLSSI